MDNQTKELIRSIGSNENVSAEDFIKTLEENENTYNKVHTIFSNGLDYYLNDRQDILRSITLFKEIDLNYDGSNESDTKVINDIIGMTPVS